MLVCRDLERAKEYGFEQGKKNLERKIRGYNKALIDSDTKLFSLQVYSCEDGYGCNSGDSLSDLDFIYDMIKDGILEKVE